MTYDQCKKAVPLIGKLMNEKEFNQMINEVFNFDKAMERKKHVFDYKPDIEHQKWKKELKIWEQAAKLAKKKANKLIEL